MSHHRTATGNGTWIVFEVLKSIMPMTVMRRDFGENRIWQEFYFLLPEDFIDVFELDEFQRMWFLR